MAKVSVVILVYGVEKYIERCAVSLFEQTLDDIEYIFVNDCTQDKSIHILELVLARYHHRANQVRIINLPINYGQAKARKVGMDLASGEYIIHCDSDDWLEHNAYELLYNNAIANNSDIVFMDYYRTDGTQYAQVSNPIDVSSKETVLVDVTKNVCWSLWRTLVRRSVYTDNTIVFPVNNNGEDFALMIQLIYYSHSYYKVNKPLYFYYDNPISITKKPTEEAFLIRYNQLKQNTDLLIRFFKEHNLSGKYRKLISCYKLYCRTKLSPLTKSKVYMKLWNSTYPELKWSDVIGNSVISLRTQLHFIAVKMRIYKLFSK